MDKMTVRDVEVGGKRVLVRVDFNVPMNEKTLEITDDSRIKASLPTIKYLMERKAKVVLLSHLGRPGGKVAEQFRMAPVAQRLSHLLGKKVATAKDCIGTEVENRVKALKEGEVILLENLRFHPEEEKGDTTFALSLARLGDLYVNDAFGTSHRPHASMSVIAGYVPAVAGFLLEKEVDTLSGILANPAQPFTALLGGAKVSDKVGLVDNIMGKVSCLLIGGGMAATFFKAKSLEVGLSPVEVDNIDTANKLMEKARNNKVRLLLPVDVVVAENFKVEGPTSVVKVESIPKDKEIVDIGPKTIEAFGKEIKASKTIFWNGPVGVYEVAKYAAGTREIARMLVASKAKTVIGGGSTADVVAEMGLTDKMTFVSTGGGASLEFLGGDKLPGVEALQDKKK